MFLISDVHDDNANFDDVDDGIMMMMMMMHTLITMMMMIYKCDISF
jgi:hypothetical protein